MDARDAMIVVELLHAFDRSSVHLLVSNHSTLDKHSRRGSNGRSVKVSSGHTEAHCDGVEGRTWSEDLGLHHGLEGKGRKRRGEEGSRRVEKMSVER